jgi:hypothetical protein
VILSDLRRYLQAHRQATLMDLAVHFDADPEAVRAMLALWISKGRVERVPLPPACGATCTLCDPGLAEVYRWRDAPEGEGPPTPGSSSNGQTSRVP